MPQKGPDRPAHTLTNKTNIWAHRPFPNGTVMLHNPFLTPIFCYVSYKLLFFVKIPFRGCWGVIKSPQNHGSNIITVMDPETLTSCRICAMVSARTESPVQSIGLTSISRFRRFGILCTLQMMLAASSRVHVNSWYTIGRRISLMLRC